MSLDSTFCSLRRRLRIAIIQPVKSGGNLYVRNNEYTSRPIDIERDLRV